ncbi:MAG: DUF4407 domain-containing protein [Saprospiraceae bacterium]|nr:DUF4407 domain-containing protein [Saprospiraceae bacterium]
MKSFFLFCSGVHQGFINRSPSEVNKYVGIGATIFFTGLLAFFSSAFAFFTVFKSYTIAIFLGMIWGLMIFNLDRYIVSSIKKKDSFGRQFVMAFPRIIFACLIAIVISKPLELKLFESEIKAELVSMEQEKYREQEELVRNRFLPDQEILINEIGQLEGQLQESENYRNGLLAEAVAEADGTGGSQIRNMGPIYRMKKAEADQAEQEFQSQFALIQPQIDSKKEAFEKSRTEMAVTIEELKLIPLDGFAARLDALSNLATSKESIMWASLFITLLFIALETAPIFVKLISEKGPLDYVQNKHESYYAFSHDLALSHLNDKKSYVTKTQNFLTSKVIEEENKIFAEAINTEIKNTKDRIIDFSFYKEWKQRFQDLIKT